MKIKVLHNCGCVGCPPFEYKPGYVFTNDAACDDYDWLVVYDELYGGTGGTIVNGRERLACPREQTILATWEPVSIKSYSRAYTRQFGHLLTNRPPEAERHPRYHLGRGYFEWFNDRSYEENATVVLPPKTRTISAVCSSKQMRRTKHFARFSLVSELAKAIPEMEWYGHGVRAFGKKYEVMDPFKYHVAVENHIAPHHWTEKLSDAFLCECLPFYAGDPAIFEVFPAESLVPIPIDDPAEAVRIVKSAIAENAYAKRREAVLEAKRLILTKYNFWAQVIDVIESAAEGVRPAPPVPEFVVNRKVLRRSNLSAALDEGWFHLRQYLHL